MALKIRNNKIYKNGEEVKPDTNGTGGKVVQGTSANGLWFQAKTKNKKFTVYLNGLMKLTDIKNARAIFWNYCNNEI